jgi:hypothetical protein
MGDIDVARAMDIAFQYRKYFRKVSICSDLEIVLFSSLACFRMSLWICWCIDDGMSIYFFVCLIYVWLKI